MIDFLLSFKLLKLIYDHPQLQAVLCFASLVCLFALNPDVFLSFPKNFVGSTEQLALLFIFVLTSALLLARITINYVPLIKRYIGKLRNYFLQSKLFRRNGTLKTNPLPKLPRRRLRDWWEDRLNNAFTGIREVTEFTKNQDIYDALKTIMAEPVAFNEHSPMCWSRGHFWHHLQSAKVIKKRKHIELWLSPYDKKHNLFYVYKIKKLTFICSQHSSNDWNKHLYIEAHGINNTEEGEYLNNCYFRGKETLFIAKNVPPNQVNDGYIKIRGKSIKVDTRVFTRITPNKDINFIITTWWNHHTIESAQLDRLLDVSLNTGDNSEIYRYLKQTMKPDNRYLNDPIKFDPKIDISKQ